ncbi:unnamed protein product, partial [Brassica napus]
IRLRTPTGSVERGRPAFGDSGRSPAATGEISIRRSKS